MIAKGRIMDIKAIEKEISELKNLKSEWTKTRMNKSKAKDLVNKIYVFNQTFSVNFPNSVNHNHKNKYAEIHITDAVSELELYFQSRLKQKDNEYFHNGMKNLKWGIEKIISDLQREIVTE